APPGDAGWPSRAGRATIAHPAAKTTGPSMSDKRVQFDFEIDFSNGGGIQGQGFRLDIEGEDIADAALAEYIVRDLRLLMVGSVRILDKRIIQERHKRGADTTDTAAVASRLVDLSHTIEHGMVTYRGLPAPVVCDFLTREASRAHYDGQAEFHIGQITMVANTGTYLDSPFHRHADGCDLSGLALESLADLKGVVIRMGGMQGRAIGREALTATDLRGKAVLVHTGWDAHWGSERYFEGHPFLTRDAAEHLREGGARLVGIDSLNIDDTADPKRPVHTILLGAGVPIVEHLRGLDQLPVDGFRFSAVPVKVRGMGTFPVRAYARIG
ncbi:MAG TPA: cyclase family protein, partial [Xanthomonadaceae bacterium]|nr:cyclase family protein [Xanthomonadaceae bacterium]